MEWLLITFWVLFLIISYVKRRIEEWRDLRQRRKIAKTTITKYTNWDQARAVALDIAGWSCEKCGSFDNLSVHHKMPLSQGGTNEISNLVVLCKTCHEKNHGFRFKHEVGDPDSFIANKYYGVSSHYVNPKVRIILEAISKNKDVFMKYTKRDYPSGETATTKRTVRPIEIYKRNGRLYFRGFCKLRNAERVFRISRIRKIKAI